MREKSICKIISIIIMFSFVLCLSGCGETKSKSIDINVNNYSTYLSLRGGVIPYKGSKIASGDGDRFDSFVVSASSEGASSNYDYDIEITLAVSASFYPIKTVYITFRTNISGNGSVTSEKYKLADLWNEKSTGYNNVYWYPFGKGSETALAISVVDVKGTVTPVN